MKFTFLRLLLLMASLLALGACSSRYDLTPPPSGPQVTVTIKVPEGASVKAIEAEYLSDRCFPPQYGPFNRYATQELKIKPKRQGDSDRYQAQLDLDGGSACHWRLATVTVGVQYWRAGKLDLAGTVREDVTAIFNVDRQGERIDELPEALRTRKELLLNAHYYPYVNTVGSGNAVIMFVASGSDYARGPAAERLVFEPRVERKLVARMSRDSAGNIVILYPDGSRLPAGTWHPDVKKLDAMRLGEVSSHE
ncbi:hypothetical protein [Pseudomonas sp. GCEP-101]|uniref:hypothetical protein n=1 Tax=Pseudomonas sp. GCEP-101 TaxID=2974552 RepID=UPI00223B66EF|nr:hypothetical protein [Pseudomonas sp. GCEP-101]